MSNSPALLVEAASAVAALGACQGDISLLDDVSLVEGMRLVRDLDSQAQSYKLWLSAEIARRSDHTLGYDGLAWRNGSATPAVFIQSVTGSSIEEATRLARLGQSMVDAEAASESEGGGPVGGASAAPIVAAAVSGGISVDAADAIRRGLGTPDSAVTAEQLASAAEELINRADAMTPEALLRAARRVRNDLDLDAIERGEKHRAATRYVRVWSRGGMSGGSWALPDEDGGLEIRTALKLLVAAKTNGPRFADVSKTSKTKPETVESTPTAEPTTEPPLVDDRSPEHIMADGFAQIFHNGLTADPSVVPGAGRAPVRVIVPERVLTDRTANGPEASPTGSAILEETHTAISFPKLEEHLCAGGTIGILFTENGQVLDAGREQRLFTKQQRTALGVRDGGCRFPGCEKPPSWTEAHHISYWARDTGPTNVTNGILLCRYHHMLIHNTGWEIHPDTQPNNTQPNNTQHTDIQHTNGHGGYWLKPPKEQDPNQRLIDMPSKNPLVAAMKHTHRVDQQLVG